MVCELQLNVTIKDKFLPNAMMRMIMTIVMMMMNRFFSAHTALHI